VPLDVDEIEAACYRHADYYYALKKRTKKIGPVIVNDADWLRWDEPNSVDGSSRMFYTQPTDALPTTGPTGTERHDSA